MLTFFLHVCSQTVGPQILSIEELLLSTFFFKFVVYYESIKRELNLWFQEVRSGCPWGPCNHVYGPLGSQEVP
jgi:hypothetical protein